jgi:hypothetical protein
MPNQRYKAEQIVNVAAAIEVGVANGKTTPQVYKEAVTSYCVSEAQSQC